LTDVLRGATGTNKKTPALFRARVSFEDGVAEIRFTVLLGIGTLVRGRCERHRGAHANRSLAAALKASTIRL
jgi:hypothetical protein